MQPILSFFLSFFWLLCFPPMHIRSYRAEVSLSLCLSLFLCVCVCVVVFSLKVHHAKQTRERRGKKERRQQQQQRTTDRSIDQAASTRHAPLQLHKKTNHTHTNIHTRTHMRRERERERERERWHTGSRETPVEGGAAAPTRELIGWMGGWMDERTERLTDRLALTKPGRQTPERTNERTDPPSLHLKNGGGQGEAEAAWWQWNE